jgi:hypothetical protein
MPFCGGLAELLDVGGTIGVVSTPARVLPAIEGVTIAHAAGLVALAGGSLATARRRCVTAWARLPAFDAGGGQKRPAQPLCRRHLIETTARPFLPHPRQRVYRTGLAVPGQAQNGSASEMLPPDPAPLLSSLGSPLRHRMTLRLLWRIVLRGSGRKAPQNQDWRGGAVPR